MTIPCAVMRTSEYAWIRAATANQTAKRSKLPYMRHIDQGLRILHHLSADIYTQRAWCVHPIFQMDHLFTKHLDELEAWVTCPRVTVLAMEYRQVANAFLTKDTWEAWPEISVLPEVNLMLIADKIQNWYDAERYVLPHVSKEEGGTLDYYFAKWRDALGVTDKQKAELEALLTEWEGT